MNKTKKLSAILVSLVAVFMLALGVTFGGMGVANAADPSGATETPSATAVCQLTLIKKTDDGKTMTVQYESLTEALGKLEQDAANPEDLREFTGEITLLKDRTESIEINEGLTVTLNLGGCILTNNDGSHTITNRGNLTIVAERSGTVDNVSNARGALVNYGTAILSGGRYTRSEEKGTYGVPNGSANGNSWYVLYNEGEMTIDYNVNVIEANGGFSSLIANNVSCKTDNAAKLIINDGTFSGGINTVKNDEAGILEINGGEFTNTVQHAILNWSEATIKGGTFTQNPTGVVVCTGKWNDATPSTTIQTTITGGTFYGAIGKTAGENGYTDAEVKLYSIGVDEDTTIAPPVFTVAPAEEYLAEGYLYLKDEASDAFVAESVEVAKAEGITTTVNGVGYASIITALNEAPAGANVKLLTSVGVSGAGALVLKSLTLDLNGKTFTRTLITKDVDNTKLTAQIGFWVAPGAENTVTIKNGYINFSNDYTLKEGATSARILAAAILANDGTLAMQDVTITGNDLKGESYGVRLGNGSNTAGEFTNVNIGIGTSGTCAVGVITANGTGAVKTTLNATECNFKAGTFALAGNGMDTNTEITLTKCDLTSEAVGIYHPQDGKLTINGGTVKGVSTGIEMRAGELTLTGGAEIIATAPQEDYAIAANGSGTTVIGAAVAISQHSTNKAIVVNIGNATLTGYKSLVQVDTTTKPENGRSEVTLNINGGTFNGEVLVGELAGEAVNDGEDARVVESFIGGGLFTVAPKAEYYKKNAYVSKNSDGQYVVKASLPEGTQAININGVNYALDVVAEVTDVVACITTVDADGKEVITGYKSLKEAVSAVPAKGATATTIKLLGNAKGDGVIVDDNKNIIFDLGGFTYDMNGATVGSTGTETQAFQLKAGSTVKFMDGTLTATATGARMIIQNYCNLTLENVKIIGNDNISYVVSNNAGSLTVKGSTEITATGNNVAFDIYYWPSGSYTGGVTVTFDETFAGKVTGKVEYGSDGTDKSNVAEKAKLIIAEGAIGTFDVTFSTYNLMDDKTGIAIAGGTFTSDLPYTYLKEHFVTEKQEDGTYGIKSGDYVATIGTAGYATVNAAIAAATDDNQEIILIGDLELTESITIPADKNVVIDLNGKTINLVATTDRTAAIVNNGTATVKNGAIIRKSSSTDWYTIYNEGTLTLENLTVKSEIESGTSMIVNNQTCKTEKCAKLNISSGTYETASTIAIKNDECGVLNITGGTFKATNQSVQNWAEATISGGIFESQVIGWNYENNKSELVSTAISGGIFNDAVYAINYNSANNTQTKAYNGDGEPQVAISDGTFSNLPAAAYFVEGKIGELNDDNSTYSVVDGKYVAMVGDLGYETLADAIEAVSANGIVKLLLDIELTTTLTINKNIILDLNSKTISYSVNDNNPVILNEGATVTIKNGAIVRTAGTNYVIKNHKGNMTLEGLTVSNSVAESGASLICNESGAVDGIATLTIKSGTYTAQYNQSNVVKNGTDDKLFIEGGTFNMTDGVTGTNAILSFGEANITGGSYNATGNAKGIYIWAYEDNSEAKAEISNVEINTSSFGIYLKITNETAKLTATLSDNIQDKDGKSVKLCLDYYVTNHSSDKWNVDITGGTYSGIVTRAETETFMDVAITGGSFETLPDYTFFEDGYAAEFDETKNAYVTKLGSWVAAVEHKGYMSLQDAIDDATEDKEIKLLDSVEEDVKIKAEQKITLNLNGFELKNKTTHTIVNYGVLIITGNGTVDNITNGCGAVVNYGTVTLSGGNYIRSAEAGSSADNNGGNSWYVLFNQGNMTIEEGVKVTSTGAFSSLIENGWYDGTKNTDKVIASLTINGGSFSGGINTVKNDDYGVTTIAGGTFTNVAQFVVLNWNELTISGGTFNVSDSAKAAVATGYLNSGYNSGTTTISGGEFNSGLTFMNGNPEGVTYNVKGGTYAVATLEELNLASLTIENVYVAYITSVTRAAAAFNVTVDSINNALNKVDTIELIAGKNNESFTGKGFKIYKDCVEVKIDEEYVIIDSARYAQMAKDDLKAYRDDLLARNEYSEGGALDLEEILSAGLDTIGKHIENSEFAMIDSAFTAYKNAMDEVLTKVAYEKKLNDTKDEYLNDLQLFATISGVSMTEESVDLAVNDLKTEVQLSKLVGRRQAVLDAINDIYQAKQDDDADLAQAKKDAIAAIKEAAKATEATETTEAQAAVVVPTATLAAINAAVDLDQVEEFKNNALAEIDDIRTFRAQINALSTNGTEVLNAIEAFKAALLGDGTEENVGKLVETEKNLKDYLDTTKGKINEYTSTELSNVQSALSQAIATAKSELATAIGEVKTKVEGIVTTLTTMGQDVTALKTAVEKIKPTDLTDVNKKLDDLKTELAAVKTTVGGIVNGILNSDAFKALATKANVEEIKTAVAALDKALLADGTGAIAKLQKALETAIGEVKTTVNGIVTSLAAMGQDVTALKAAVEAINTTDLSAVSANIDTLKATLEKAIADSAKALDDKINALTDSVGTFTGKLEEVSNGLIAEMGQLDEKIAKLGSISTDNLNSELGDLATELEGITTAINAIAEKVQTGVDIEKEKTNAINSINKVLNNLLGETQGEKARAVATAASEESASGLTAAQRDKLNEMYGAKLAALIEQYYNDAMEDVANATTISEAQAAANNFKRNLDTAKMINSIDSGVSSGVYVMLTFALIFSAAAVVLVLVLLLKKRNTSSKE